MKKDVKQLFAFKSDSQIYDDYVACRERDMQIMRDAEERRRIAYKYHLKRHNEYINRK